MVDEKRLKYFKAMVDELEATSSSTAKQTILSKYLKKEKTTSVLILLNKIYDYRYQYNLKHTTAMKKGTCLPKATMLMALLRDLEARKITGQRACDEWFSFVLSLPAELHDIAGRILDKDLKCRLGIATINKVLTQKRLPLIPEYKVALGVKWDGQEIWKGNDTWYASRKLDGVRCQIILGGEKPIFLSRQGKPFDTLGELEKAFRIYPKISEGFKPIILDGELALRTKDGEDDFQGLMKQIRRKNHTIKNIVFHAFDCFFIHEENRLWHTRQEYLKYIVDSLESDSVKVVKQLQVHEWKHFYKLIASAQKRGWEGLILRRDAQYKQGRSKDILKVKTMQDAEYKVIGIEIGKMNIIENGKERQVDIMRSAIISHKKSKVHVGSGWSIEQRRKFCNDPSKIVGKIITVQYFEETENVKGGHGLRFPVVKTIHGLKRTT